MNPEKLTELLQYLARSLVHNREAVEIHAEEGDSTLTLKLKVAEEDMGRVIGKGGKTAQAIRTLVKAAWGQSEKKVAVEILD